MGTDTTSTFQSQLNLVLKQWVENHKRLKGIVKDPGRFIVYNGKNEIEVNLQQLDEAYFNKHITDDMDAYCMKLLKGLEKPLFIALANLRPKDYQFHYTFMYWGRYIGKTVNYYLLTRVQ